MKEEFLFVANNLIFIRYKNLSYSFEGDKNSS